MEINYPFVTVPSLEAGQSFITRRITYVPVGRFDLVEAYVKVYTAGGDSLKVDYEHEVKTSETNSTTSRQILNYYRPIREPSWITDMTRFERGAEAVYSYQPNQPDSEPNWDYVFCHDNECGGDYRESLSDGNIRPDI